MENKITRFKYLFERYTAKRCTIIERSEFLDMVKTDSYIPVLKNLIKEEVEISGENLEMEDIKSDEIFNKIIQVAKAEDIIKIHHKKYNFRWWAAAAVFIIVTIGSYSVLRHSERKLIAKNIVHPVTTSNDVAPGHSGAILTLANGKKIILDSAHNGLLANQGNAVVVKEDGKISYTDKKKTVSEIMYNTMTTPNGRKYQLELSDGSMVWLNAASSITYPTAFGDKERRVSITGEAYFEIKHLTTKSSGSGKIIPFIVSFSTPKEKGEIKVLGTHFNVMAYSNEAAVKTTLLEGSVKISKNNKTVTIKPGEQAIVNNNGNNISVINADVEEAVAWKDGFFNFKNATIETIMRQVARWYDVDVIYKGEKPNSHYGGEVSRDVNASEMLKVLEVGGIHFKIEGRKIIIMK